MVFAVLGVTLKEPTLIREITSLNTLHMISGRCYCRRRSGASHGAAREIMRREARADGARRWLAHEGQLFDVPVPVADVVRVGDRPAKLVGYSIEEHPQHARGQARRGILA
jgi:hypothetical protein